MAGSDKLQTVLIYALMKTKAKLQSTFDAVVKMEEPDEAYKAFQSAHQALVKKALVKDGKVENPAELEAAFEALKLEHKPAIDAREEALKPVQEFIKTEEEFALHMAPQSWLPAEMTPAVFEALEPMITQSEE